MTRRELLAAASAACASPLWARERMDKSRISAITDEIGLSTEESIEFAHHYGLHFVEIRNPAGSKKEYFSLTEGPAWHFRGWFLIILAQADEIHFHALLGQGFGLSPGARVRRKIRIK